MPDNKKILIVEDDKFLAKMLARMLEERQLTVILAGTGKEGLTKAVSDQPDLILLDIMLPDSDGFDILRQLKEDDHTKKIPVVIISNLGQPEDVAQSKKLGAVDHLIKSDLALDEVAAKVNQYLAT